MYYLGYDLETTGFDPVKNNIVEFAAIILDKDLKEVERVQIFHKVKIGDYLLKTNGQEYQDKVNELGLEKEEFLKEVKIFINKYNLIGFIGQNIRGFDNKWLKTQLQSKHLLYLLKQHDTLIYERLLLGLDNFSKLPNGTKIGCTLEDMCKRYEIEFDPQNAHEGSYDVEKTVEVFKKQKEIIEENLKRELEVEEQENDFDSFQL